MNADNEEDCSVCGGSGVNKPSLQDMNDAEENGGVQYQSLECSHCKGTGKEPK